MKHFFKHISKNKRGFTLIELLVVIAVMGVLAATVLVAVDPLEQLARGRDAGMKSAVVEVGKGMYAYGISRNGVFLDPAIGDTAFLTTLQTAGEIKVIPSRTVVVSACAIVAAGKSKQNNFCYATNTGTASQYLVYATPESKAVRALCANQAWYVYSSADGRAGVVCTAATTTEPTVGGQTFAGP